MSPISTPKKRPRQIVWLGRTIEVPDTYRNADAIKPAHLEEMRNAVEHLPEKHRDARVNAYINRRVGWSPATGVYSHLLLMGHREAMDNVLSVCFHKWKMGENRRVVDSHVLGTWTVYNTHTCEYCGAEDNRIMARNNWSGD